MHPDLPAQQPLRISLLGGFRMSVGATPVTSVGTPRLQALVTYLLLKRDAPQTRQQIAFLFWPDSSEEQARSNLRNLILSLARNFADFADYISVERNTLQWRNDSRYELDVIEFERRLAQAEHDLQARKSDAAPYRSALPALQEAIELYAGDLLPACYDEWVLDEREHLRQGFLWALAEVVSSLESNGDLGTAILYAQRLLRHDPLQEENYRRVMRLHIGRADRSGAVSVYKQCERMLRSELGLEPSDLTRELLERAERLATHEPAVQRRANARSGNQGRTVVPSTLPAQTTSFIGRENHVTGISRQLREPECRLLTVIGTGGTGKTRLALQVAASTDAFSDGVFFVPLAPLSDPQMVEHSIAQALGITLTQGVAVRHTLIEALNGKQLLLVLDNFEHLLEAAPLVSDLLASCPVLKVLVTSRALLNLRGEREYSLPPMTVPPAGATAEPDDLLYYESVALFVKRAVEASPQFALTRANARAIAGICRKLEGLPLAIELAAARVKVLSPEAILSRLDHRLKLLTGGKADLPPRQQALETAIAWSYNLLDQNEKRVFRSLSVFAGGCSLEAAEAVLGGAHREAESDVLDLVSSLLSKSLLVRADTLLGASGENMEPRFSMLETLREYGADRLAEAGELASVTRLHSLYFAQLIESAAANFFGPEQAALFERVELEYDNIVAALRWSCDVREADIALRLAGSLDRFWERRGNLSEGREWLERAVALPGSRADSRSRANALRGLGRFQFRLGEYADAERTLMESVALFEEAGDREGTADALNVLAVSVGMNEYDRALEIQERCLAIRREIDDRWGIVSSLQNIAMTKIDQGKFEEARALCSEALELQGGGNSDTKAAILYAQGLAILNMGEHAEGERILQECIALCRELKNNRLMGWALHQLAGMHYTLGDFAKSQLLNTESLDLFTEQGAKPGIAHAITRLGRDAQRAGDYRGAGELYLQALSQGREISLQPVLGQSLAGLGGVAAALGCSRTSAILFGKAQAVLAQIYSSIEREEMTLGMESVQALLGPEEWQDAWHEGGALTVDQASKIAQEIF